MKKWHTTSSAITTPVWSFAFQSVVFTVDILWHRRYWQGANEKQKSNTHTHTHTHLKNLAPLPQARGFKTDLRGQEPLPELSYVPHPSLMMRGRLTGMS